LRGLPWRLLDKVCNGPVDQRLHLPSLLPGEGAHGLSEGGIDLGGELLSLLSGHFLAYHGRFMKHQAAPA
jgi:hypothetical protein